MDNHGSMRQPLNPVQSNSTEAVQLRPANLWPLTDHITAQHMPKMAPTCTHCLSNSRMSIFRAVHVDPAAASYPRSRALALVISAHITLHGVTAASAYNYNSILMMRKCYDACV